MFAFFKPKAAPFADALRAMQFLLHALHETHWIKWIEKDINEWEQAESTEHHLAAYGGMGSFNDLWFEDIWLNTLFQDLSSVCYYLAHHPKEQPNIENLQASMGTIGAELSGCRCRVCGYGVISKQNLESFVAWRVIRNKLVPAVKRRELFDLVRSVVERIPEDDVFTTSTVSEWVQASGLHLRESHEMIRLCPECKSDETAIYRWLLATSHNYRFVPANDNLPMLK